MGSFTRYITPPGGREGALLCFAIVYFIWRAIDRDAGEGVGGSKRSPRLLVGGAGGARVPSITLTFFYHWLIGLESLC